MTLNLICKLANCDFYQLLFIGYFPLKQHAIPLNSISALLCSNRSVRLFVMNLARQNIIKQTIQINFNDYKNVFSLKYAFF